MHEFEDKLNELDALLLDMDGVLYVGDSIVEGSKKAIQSLREKNKKLCFLTNNSTQTREDYQEKLSRLGLNIDKSEIVTSGYTTALYLSERYEDKKCYVVGEEGLKKELEKAGFEILSSSSAEEASFVVAGMDRGLTYDKISAGLSALLKGADFIATNPDPTYPMEKGLAPGAGATIGALSGAAEREPLEVIGKPSRYMVDFALDMLGVSSDNAAIIGDRVDMDVQAGKNAGLTTVLVLTGVDSEEDVEAVAGTDEAPDFVSTRLAELCGG